MDDLQHRLPEPYSVRGFASPPVLCAEVIAGFMTQALVQGCDTSHLLTLTGWDLGNKTGAVAGPVHTLL